MIGNIIAKNSQDPPQNNSKPFENEKKNAGFNEEIPKERYI